jgi:beta-N-acetylhexosaminidase
MKKSQMELRQQVSQLLIMGLEGPEVSGDNLRSVTRLRPGGVILFARNIESGEQCYDLLAACRKTTPVAMFTCVDLEGGLVDRFREVIAPAPSQHKVAETKSKTLFRKHGEILGAEARALGFNTDFAPVSDIGFAASQSVLGSRTVSPIPEETIIYVREFLRGMKSAGVLGCGKHFPGLGEASLDSHFAMPTVMKPWKALWEQDLLPYRKLHKQFPFVMIAHAAYPAVTKNGTPASLSSRWMNDILRKKIGFRGLVLSDDLEMGGVLAAGTLDEVAVECVRSGADMFLVCRKEEFVLTCFEAVLREAEKDESFAKLVARACERVLAYKKRSKELKAVAGRPNGKTIERLRKQLQHFEKQIARHGANR